MPAEKTGRNREMVRLRVDEGLTYQEIAKRFGVSKQMVALVVKRLGVKPRHQRPPTPMDERELFEFIVRYKLEHDGVAPTIGEMVKGTSFVSSSTVYNALVKLERQGLIKERKGEGNRRGIEITGGYMKAAQRLDLDGWRESAAVVVLLAD